MRRLISVSVFWNNDKPDGIGLTFSAPGFSPTELEEMFVGQTMKEYFRNSDLNLGTHLVGTYLDQIRALAQEAKRGPLPMPKALLVALNICYLADRGFLVNDEFNGPQFIWQSE